MDTETWQQLLPLESTEIIKTWYHKIHSRSLNTTKANQITAAAKQAKEYFRNATHANYFVKPLLTFYGVASLSRALILLLSGKGEEQLIPGHGLVTVDWKNVLSSDVFRALPRLGELTIKTSSGLFTHLLSHTNNVNLIHYNSSAVNWILDYDHPEQGVEITVDDLIARIPDLASAYRHVSSPGMAKYSHVNKMSYVNNKFMCEIHGKDNSHLLDAYDKDGYSIFRGLALQTLSTQSDVFNKTPPFVVHSYLDKSFIDIPRTCIAEPFAGSVRYSELCMIYMLSYTLGMLVRYYPSHWMSLTNGGTGDQWWPVVQTSQNFIEVLYPKMVAKFIHYTLENPVVLESR